ncbi:dUTP diphosphatase [Modestobacter roseus]|uniref:Deoxyuridine 5'-triphosphate nucleotidohydrolase n=1 Tax=Modestobacter roseus TaxID=1181884 RepID=A0A562IR48_9ACTN|nr:dUTP diphosphatase [Modestobacter roseus]TWH73481.1 deoxyuridine 5'-triphosphate nucleotidohydrolase [Modestobacter roseus]
MSALPPGSPVPADDDVVDVPVLLTGAGAVAPVYALPGDAGADLCLAEDVELAPHQRALVGTGVAVAIPAGYAGFVHPRSGLAHRLGLSLVNAPGTIDAGYRGEIKVNLVNLDPRTTLRLSRGDRVAQLVVQPVVRARFVPVTELPRSERGSGGHGSTGGATALAADPTAHAADTAPTPDHVEGRP